MEQLEPKAQEAILVLEMLKLPRLHREDKELWELWNFMGRPWQLVKGGFMDQPMPEIARLRNVEAWRSIGRSIIHTRDRQVQYMEAVRKSLEESGITF